MPSSNNMQIQVGHGYLTGRLIGPTREVALSVQWHSQGTKGPMHPKILALLNFGSNLKSNAKKCVIFIFEKKSAKLAKRCRFRNFRSQTSAFLF